MEEIARRDGRLVYADVEITQRDPSGTASPLIWRFVWDGEDQSWLPWNALLLGDMRYPMCW